MSQYKTKYYPNLFEMGGAFTRPFNRAIDAFDRTNVSNGIYQFHEIAKQVSSFLRTDKAGPWSAIVLAVEEIIYDGKAGTMGLVNQYSMKTPTDAAQVPQTFIKVWARRMPDDQSIPQPDFSYLNPAWHNPQRELQVKTPAQREAIIQMHPTYIISKDEWAPRRVPQPLDVVSVSFEDKLNQTRGRLVDFLEQGNLEPAAAGPTPANTPGGATVPTPSAAFADLSRPVSTVFDEERGPQIQMPPADLWAEANTIVDQMCPGPDIESPNNLQFAQGGKLWNGAIVQTIIWDNGRPIPRDAAPYVVALFNAAKRDGITLSLNSGMRTQYDNIVGSLLEPFMFDENDNPMGWVGHEGSPLTDRFLNKIQTKPNESFAASQAECRRQNCTPKELALTREAKCDPKTGFPTMNSKYPYGHSSGYAVDIQTNMSNTGEKPQANISKQSRWLCLNAYKFGFIRDVRSERWHWSLRILQQPLPHQFDNVKRSSGSWDGQFNGDLKAQFGPSDDDVESFWEDHAVDNEEGAHLDSSEDITNPLGPGMTD